MADKWAADYDHRYPSNFWAHKRFLPVVRAAAIAMGKGNGADAVEHLKAVSGDIGWFGNDPSAPDVLLPAYLRAQAYLQLGRSISKAY